MCCGCSIVLIAMVPTPDNNCDINITINIPLIWGLTVGSMLTGAGSGELDSEEIAVAMSVLGIVISEADMAQLLIEMDGDGGETM